LPPTDAAHLSAIGASPVTVARGHPWIAASSKWVALTRMLECLGTFEVLLLVVYKRQVNGPLNDSKCTFRGGVIAT